MKKIFYTALIALSAFFISETAMAQRGYNNGRREDRTVYNNQNQRGNVNRKYSRVKKNNRRNVPWAKSHNYNYQNHVYFPDYQTFYDARRGGYEYRNGNKWVFSSILPAFLQNINLNTARIQIMASVPLTTTPERYYNTYYRKYPPRRR